MTTKDKLMKLVRWVYGPTFSPREIAVTAFVVLFLLGALGVFN